MLRTNYFRRRRRRRAAAPYLSFKLDPRADPAAAAAAAAVRDLRLLAAGRGRAPARRQGRARRAALVGPPRGLPHRGPRADEGADGQERADRPGRLEGRLRGQAAAGEGGREALLDEGSPATGRSCRGLLDITDNIVGGRGRRRPSGSCATTSDDPYLVVAADKGTATFSDIANEVSAAATASGSATRSPRAARSGYDHKAMGITARGAWESVKRHFRELGIDVQADGLHRRRDRRHVAATCSATACCSRATSELVAAFNHLHVFLDPDPGSGAQLRGAQAAVRAAALVVERLRRRR